MRHDICPLTMTPEQLADWIRSNKVDQVNHSEKIPLTEEEINTFQRDSSLASRSIDKLKQTLKYFTALIKKGTPWDSITEHHKPISVTIPPSKGLEKLQANREFADMQLEQGYREDVTSLYFIPWPEYEKMIAMTIEGEEWSSYSRRMTEDEVKQHGKPILRASADMLDVLEANDIEIEKIDGRKNEVTLKKKSKNKEDEDLTL